MATKIVKFQKWHGLGNDFVIVDDRQGKFRFSQKQVAKMGDRHYGIGFDQMMVVRKSKKADFKMELFNRDGSKVEMCGNGIRCFAMFLLQKKITKKTSLEIETMAGIIRPKIKGKMVEVDMGEPVLDGPKIPVSRLGQIVNMPMKCGSELLKVTAVSMGNPHAVIFVKSLAKVAFHTLGPLMESSPLFPRKTNVEFVEVLHGGKVNVKVWERGAGPTLACGTGACAVAVAGVLTKNTNRKVEVNLPGGKLKINWDEKTNHVFMTGSATEVFSGEYSLQK